MIQGSDDPTLGRVSLNASPRLFESNVLDKLSRVHHLTPVFVYGPIILALAAYSVSLLGGAATLAWFGLGVLGWSLTEYLGHRFLFHHVFSLPYQMGPRLQFLIHGVHHTYPNDPLRLVMPPLLSGAIMLIALGVIRLVFGAHLAWPILAGFMLGYLVYDCVHYWLHNGIPRSRFGRFLRKLHMRHHFHDETKGYGVMSIWWDYAFNTLDPRVKSVASSVELPPIAEKVGGDAL